jgi:hypothetical protein
MVLIVESPAVDKVALAAPVASVVACVTARPPEVAANATVTPDIRLLFASRARTVMVAVVEPSDRIDVALVIAVSDVGPVAPLVDTFTEVLPDTLPAVAVTVIDVPVATPDAVSEVVTFPLESVVPVLAEMVPAVVVNVTATPDTGAPLEFVTTAVIVAEAEPSGGTAVTLLVTATAAGVDVGVLLVQPDVPELPPVPPPLKLPQPLLPPQPASARVSTNRAIIDASVRMFLLPEILTGCRRGPRRINTR